MKWGWAKAAGGVLATAAATAVNPLFGLAVGTAIGGKGSKVAGKTLEARTGLRVHKVATPALVAGIPALLAGTGAVDVSDLCDLAARACANPAALGAAVGVVLVFLHQLWSGVRKVAPE